MVLRASPNRGFRGSTHTELAEAAMQAFLCSSRPPTFSAVDLPHSVGCDQQQRVALVVFWFLKADGHERQV
jgi:hypothetical protein